MESKLERGIIIIIAITSLPSVSATTHSSVSLRERFEWLPFREMEFHQQKCTDWGEKNYNPYTESLDNIVIWVPGYTTGHLDACSVALSVPKAHMGHLVSCSAATDSPKALLVNSTSLSYNADRYNAEDAMISRGLTRIDRYGMSILEAQLRLSGFETKL